MGAAVIFLVISSTPAAIISVLPVFKITATFLSARTIAAYIKPFSFGVSMVYTSTPLTCFLGRLARKGRNSGVSGVGGCVTYRRAKVTLLGKFWPYTQ